MNNMDRIKIYNAMFSEGMIPLFYSGDKENVLKVTSSLVQGGSSIIEFTNRGPLALETFSYLKKKASNEFPELIVGAGTIFDANTAALFISKGADFIVSPIFDIETVKLCNKKRIPYIPGCATINEIIHAEEYGVEIIKIFPANTIGGPSFVKALKGPCPKTKVMPTGGVTCEEENIREWFKAGVSLIGIGSNLIPKDLSGETIFVDIKKKTKKVLKIIRDIKLEISG